MNMIQVDNLPSEILMSMLSTLDTRTLLNLTTVSKRFHYLVLRVLYSRLLITTEIPQHKIILEAYHPSRRYHDPYISCVYHDTPGIDAVQSVESELDFPEQLAQLDAIYTRFRPERPLIHGPLPVRRAPPTTTAPHNISTPEDDAKITRNINLDEDELFGQFCAYASLIKPGQKPGFFSSTVPIVENGKGVMRVWRQWLEDRVLETEQETGIRPGSPSNDSSTSLVSTSDVTPDHHKSKNILWTDSRHNVGLKVKIQHLDESLLTPNPFQPPPSHTMPVNHPSLFSIEIQELVVRTTHLMTALEDSVRDESRGICGDRALVWVSLMNQSLIKSSTTNPTPEVKSDPSSVGASPSSLGENFLDGKGE